MISRATVINGFEVNGVTRYDVALVFRGELPADRFNEENERFEIVVEDIPFLIEDGLELIGVEVPEVADVSDDGEGEGDDSEGDDSEGEE